MAPATVTRRVRPAGGNRVVALVAVALPRRQAPGRAAGLDAVHAPARLAHQPEAVSADAVHVRVDDRDRRRHGDHGLDGIAALGQHRLAGLGREAWGAATAAVEKIGVSDDSGGDATPGTGAEGCAERPL